MHRHSLLPLVGARFQDLFHRPPGLLFTVPSRYSSTIGHERVFSLGGRSPPLPTGFLGPRRTQVPAPPRPREFRLRDSHPLWWSVPARFDYPPCLGRGRPPRRPYNPGSVNPVWALPLPLAATQGISLDFFSWSYLDVSVRSVGLSRLSIHQKMTGLAPRRVSPFGHPGITGCVLLPRASRSLPRPSSPARA